MRIANKKEFYERSEKGLCGNTPRVWYSGIEFWQDRAFGRFSKDRNVGLRTLVPGDGRGVPNIDPHNAFIRMKFNPGVYYISEIPSKENINDRHGLQGEFTWVNGEWWFYYTHHMGYMRQRLKDFGQHACGWQAIRLLRGHLDADDYDTLIDLFEHYTDGDDYPIIELANFRQSWGRFNRRLIIWEIRNGY